MILQNQVRCKKCNETISSSHRHDFITCRCSAVSVDGGYDYLKRCGDIENWEEQSIFIDDNLGWLLIEQITYAMGDADAFSILRSMCDVLREKGVDNVLDAIANPSCELDLE